MADRTREIRGLAVKLLDEAFGRLARERILPRSRYEPWVRVGSEFEGWLVDGAPSFDKLVASLEAAFPRRFAGEPPTAKDFASLYPSSLVTAAVARLTRAQQPYEGNQPAALDVVRGFVRYVSSDSVPAVAIYIVAGIQTPDHAQLKTRGLAVLSMDRGFDTKRSIEEIIPGAGFDLRDASLFRVGLPCSLLVASGHHRIIDSTRIDTPFSRASSTVTTRLDGLVSAIRLATNGTIHVLGYAIGQPGPFQQYRARVGENHFDPLADVRRVITLDSRLVSRLDRLDSLWRATVPSEKGIVPTLSIAIARFNRSFGEENWQERLVDLAIALEAALGQEDETAEVSLRLRNRAAALLADPSDDAGRIFDDLGVIYDLRSRVLHGSSQSSQKLISRIEKVPATASGAMPGIKAELLVDRCRDLVRRAILARLFLAQGEPPAWPLRRSDGLDKRLADDAERKALRSLWRNRLRTIGLAPAASPAAIPSAFGAADP